mgnify:CR=1 FL=1
MNAFDINKYSYISIRKKALIKYMIGVKWNAFKLNKSGKGVGIFCKI